MKSSILRNISRIFFWGVFLCCSKATGREPVSIHLELAKNTLALAEATVLTVTISNNSTDEVLLDNLFLFKASQSPYPFKLYMITPNGENWLYRGGRAIQMMYLADSPIYFFLQPKEQVSEEIFLWATLFAPEKYQPALEKLPPGTYKLFASYDSPHQKDLSDKVIYSDTVEFIYLPLKPQDSKSIMALTEMDSLKKSFNISFLPRNKERLERIRDSHTSYSEAAHATLLSVILFSLQKDSYQEFTAEKIRFDREYPNSPFHFHILKLQAMYAESRGMNAELDSINKLLIKNIPHDRMVLSSHNMLKTATSKDIEERRVQ